MHPLYLSAGTHDNETVVEYCNVHSFLFLLLHDQSVFSYNADVGTASVL